MQENTLVEEAIEPCRVCGSIEFNLSCEHCREILLTSGKSFSDRGTEGERVARGN